MKGKYKTIVVDPPWKYGSWGKASNRGSRAGTFREDINISKPLPYPSLSVEDIKALPIASLSDDDCECYLWVTSKYLPVGFEILKAWGFKYCQTLVWCKTPRGLGQGGVYTPTTEFILLGRKGKAPKVRRVDSTWWNWKRPHNKHSAKPEEFQDLIETVSVTPRVELFARRKREGWDVWGNEVESDIELM